MSSQCFQKYSPNFIVLFLLLLSIATFSCSGDDSSGSGGGGSPDADDDLIDTDGEDSPTDGDEPITDGDEPITDGDIEISGEALLNEVDCHGRDWIEIANPSADSTADVSGWLVADHLSNAGHQYVIPQGSLIEPLGYLVIKEEKDQDPGFTFGIKCGSDTVYLIAPGGIVIDEIEAPAVGDDNTYGRLPDMTGDWRETLPTQGSANQLPSTMTDLLFDPMSVVTIDITLSEESRAALISSPYQYAPATFQLHSADGLSFDPMTVGVRLKSGSSFRPLAKKAAFKIKFNKYDSYQRLFGLKNLTLNNMIDDPTMIRETIANRIFLAFDAPASRTGYAWIKVNGEDYGLYANIEKYDDIYLSKMFPDSKHLYEGGSVDLYVGQAANFEVDEGDPNDISDLENFISVINTTPADQWLTEMLDVCDLTEMVRMWVTENYIGHNDGYTVATNNYYLHSDGSGVFSMLPWGTDRTFVEHLAFPTGTGVAFDKCINNATCGQIYDTQLAILLNVIDTLDLDSYITQLLAAINSSIESDAGLAGDMGMEFTLTEHQTAIEELRTYLAERRQEAGMR